MTYENEFRDKTVLVTGAGQGIGRHLVYELKKLGAKIIAVSQTQARLDSLKQDLGDAVTTVCVDLADWDSAEPVLKPHCANVDFLVNNAGYAFIEPLEMIPSEEVSRILDINVKAPILLTKLVMHGMRERHFGAIVNVSSVASMMAVDGHVPYAASKAALDMVTKVTALELGAYDVRVNSVNPTVVWTEMGKKNWSDPVKGDKLKQKIPLGRFVEIDEVIQPILFLLSSKASMISGTTMPIDGGLVAC